METAAEIVRNFTQRLRDFIAFMEDNSGEETPRFRSASMSDRDMEQFGPEIDTSDEGHRVAAPVTNDIFRGFHTTEHRGENSLNMPGVATANRNGIFDHFYTGEDHDDSSRHMPGTLWSELPSPPGRFPPGSIPAPPPMQAGGANNVFYRLNTGEYHDHSSLNMPGSPSHGPGILWPEQPGPPGRFTHDPIPLSPPMQTNSTFGHFYTGERRDDSSSNMPGTLWYELPTSPPMRAGGSNNIFGHSHTGEHRHGPSFTYHTNDAGPAPVMHGTSFTSFSNEARLAPVMQAGANFLDQLPDISLDDIPNATGCNICMEPFGSTEDPESPVQLPCGHVMGRKCISRWLETSNSCPLCRHVLFEQGRGFQFEQEGSVIFGQENFNRSWDNLEPRLQELIRSMTPQEQHDLLQVLQEPAPPETETVQREQVEVPWVSREELEAYRVEFHEISIQRAAIDTRMTDIERQNGPLNSQRATELRELEEDNEMLLERLDNFHARYRDLINFTLFDQAV